MDDLDDAYRKSENKIIYNKEQKEAISNIINFIEYGSPKEYYLLEGKAGTGKTTVIAEVLKNYTTKTILACALSHKAKSVIQGVLEKNNISATFTSIAGALGMDFDIETGRFINGARKIVERPINKPSIIIVDEGSMVNEEIIDLLFSYKRSGSKLIFLGDIGQLPPIRSKSNDYYADWTDDQLDIVSPIFLTVNKSRLINRVRQGEESPILPFADYFWDNSQAEFPILHPTKEFGYDRKNIYNKNGALIFVNKSASIMKQLLELFKKGVEIKDHNFIKFITYKNNTKNSINTFIHNSLFPESDLFCVGEPIIFNDEYGDIKNSTETEILKVSERDVDKYGVGYYTLELRRYYNNDELTDVIYIIDNNSKERHENVVSDLFKLAYKFKNSDRNKYLELLREAWGYKKNYANVDYSYSITSHKSQGSTYNISVTHETDINSVVPTTNRAKSQSIYTSITRAKNMAIIISDLTVKKDFELKKYNLVKLEEKINNS